MIYLLNKSWHWRSISDDFIRLFHQTWSSDYLKLDPIYLICHLVMRLLHLFQASNLHWIAHILFLRKTIFGMKQCILFMYEWIGCWFSLLIFCSTYCLSLFKLPTSWYFSAQKPILANLCLSFFRRINKILVKNENCRTRTFNQIKESIYQFTVIVFVDYLW